MCPLLWQCHSVLITVALLLVLKSENVSSPPILFFVFHYSFGYYESFEFPYEFWDKYVIPEEKNMWNFDRDCVASID